MLLRLSFILLILYSSSVDAVSVIAHEMVKQSSLTTAQLRRIYAMRTTQWPNSTQNIVVFVLASDNETHKKFCATHLRIFPYMLDRIWDKLTFSGLGTKPIEVANLQELITMVKSTPGAIGYAENVDMDGGVNVINISK